MDVLELALPGLLLIRPPKFPDERGFVSETYNAEVFRQFIGNAACVQDNHSFSHQAGTVRGIHFQKPPFAQGKLVRVLRGRVYDVAVDLRHGSPGFGRYVGIEMCAADWTQLWIPVGFAHGFCTMEPETEVLYKLTAHFSPEHEQGIVWNDPGLNIEWPVDARSAIVSAKDRGQPRFRDLPRYFSFGQGRQEGLT